MMSEQQPQQFDDTESESLHHDITTLESNSFVESPSHSPPYQHLILGDLSHLQQPAPSHAHHQHHYYQQQQQQQQKGHYFSREGDDREDETEDDQMTNGEDSSSNSSSYKNPLRRGVNNSPFSPHCRIPLPDFTFGFNNGGGANNGLLLAHHLDTGTFIRRRNERERTRVRNVNEGFERLRAHLPPLFTPSGMSCSSNSGGGGRGRSSSREREGSRKSNLTTSTSTSTAESRRLSKVETLRLAIAYIKQLQEALRS